MGEGLENCSLPLSLGCVEGIGEVDVAKSDDSPLNAVVGESVPLDGLDDRSNPKEDVFISAPTNLDFDEGMGKKGKGKRKSPISQPSPALIGKRASQCCLAPYWREWALRHLGLSPQQIAIDLFPCKGLEACANVIEGSRDVFAFDWSKLCQGSPGNYLWANPPFGSMHRVVEKIALEECKVVLVTPVWEETSWWPILKKMAARSGGLPRGEHLFHDSLTLNLLPSPRWRAMVWVIDGSEGRS